MKRFLTPAILVFFIGIALLTACLNWYRGSGLPLSETEQHDYLDQLSQQSGEIARFLDIETTKKFLQSDDGRGFYVLNLFRFNDKAIYEGKENQNISGQEAFNKFSQKVIPLWLAKGSHPIFASSFKQKGYNDWDFVSLVRYRSRRDFIAIQTSDELLAALPDRIAASKDNLRIRISGNQLPIVVALLLLVGVLVWTLLFILACKVFFSKQTDTHRQT